MRSHIALALITTTLAQAAPQQSATAPLGSHGFCGCDRIIDMQALALSGMRSPSPCGLTNDDHDPLYETQNRPELQISVVIHVLESKTNRSVATTSRINHQMVVLNDAFQSTGISFVLDGVNVHDEEERWALDDGEYWNALSQDPTSFVNVYIVNDISSYADAFGYVPGFPATPGFAGTQEDRIVIEADTLLNTPPASAFNGEQRKQCKVLVHEMGHYLGLYHTFETSLDDNSPCPLVPNGAGLRVPDCLCVNTAGNSGLTGDLVEDTEVSSYRNSSCNFDVQNMICSSTYGMPVPFIPCGQSASLASSCPSVTGAMQEWANFMSYSGDNCQTEFTPGQARRMHCTLAFHRPGLATPTGPAGGVTNYCDSNPNSTGNVAQIWPAATSSTGVLGNNFSVEGTDFAPFQTYVPLLSQTQGWFPIGGGVLCLSGSIASVANLAGSVDSQGGISFTLDWSAIPFSTGIVQAAAGETWNLQVWFREPLTHTSSANTSNALSILLQ